MGPWETLYVWGSGCDRGAHLCRAFRKCELLVAWSSTHTLTPLIPQPPSGVFLPPDPDAVESEYFGMSGKKVSALQHYSTTALQLQILEGRGCGGGCGGVAESDRL
jgi:hypothetical protein